MLDIIINWAERCSRINVCSKLSWSSDFQFFGLVPWNPHVFIVMVNTGQIHGLQGLLAHSVASQECLSGCNDSMWGHQFDPWSDHSLFYPCLHGLIHVLAKSINMLITTPSLPLWCGG